MNPLKLQIVIDAQNKANAAFKGVSGQFTALNDKINKLQPAFKGMAVAGTAALTAVAGVVGVSIKNYVEAERSVRQLEHAVIDVSKGNRDQVDSILAVTAALQKKSGIDGDALTMGAAQLSTFGLQTQSVLDLTKSLADLTVNQSGLAAGADDYVSSANVMAKALQGQFGVLEKSGIRFTEAQQNLIKYGTESQKVAALTEGLNQNLRETTDTISNTAEAGFAKRSQSIGDISEAIGGAFLPILQQVVERVIPVVQAVSAWAEANPDLVKKILLGVAAAGAFLAVVGTIGMVIPSLIVGFQTLAVAAQGLGIAFTIMTGPVGIVIAIIGALIVAGVLLYRHWDQVKKFAEEKWGMIRNIIVAAVEKIVEKFNELKGRVSDAIDGVVQKFQEFYAKVQGIWESIKTFVTEKIDQMKGAIQAVHDIDWNAMGQTLLTKFTEIYVGLWQYVVQTWGMWFEAIGGFFMEMMTRTADGFVAWGIQIENWFKGIPDRFNAWFDAWTDVIYNWFAAMPDKITTWFTEWSTRITNWFNATYDSISAGVTAWGENLGAWFEALPERITAWLDTSWQAFKEWFLNLFKTQEAAQATNTSVLDMITRLGESFDGNKLILIGKWTAIFMGVLLTLPLLLALSLATFALDMTLKIVAGIAENAPKIKDAIISAFEAAFNSVLGKVGEWVNSITSKITQGLSKLQSGASSAISTVTKAVTGRATGGPVGTDGPHMVGENGPELFWPSSAGRIIPNGAGGGGLTIVLQGNTFMGQEGIAEQIGDRILDIVKKNIKM